MADEFDENSSAMATRSESAVATPAALPMSDIQLRIARDNPRDEAAIGKRIATELRAHPTFADEGLYSIPYKDNRKGVITFVEGLSIRAAEHIWTRWGNCTVAARIADDRGEKVMVQGMFFDYETGLLHLTDLEVSKMGKSKGGGSYRLDNAKLRLAVQSAESKVKRNAFLGGLPVWTKQGYLDLCRELILIQPAGKEKTIEERIDAAKLHFTNRWKVAPADVEKFIVKVTSANPAMQNHELLRYMIGLNNAMKDGNADVDFVFGEDREPAQMPQEKKKETKNADKKSATPAAGEVAKGDEPGDAQER